MALCLQGFTKDIGFLESHPPLPGLVYQGRFIMSQKHVRILVLALRIFLSSDEPGILFLVQLMFVTGNRYIQKTP